MPFPNQKNEINSCEIHMRQYHYFRVELVFSLAAKRNLRACLQMQTKFSGLQTMVRICLYVEGNTASHIIILIVHGGPGDGSFDYADYKTARLREKYAVAFWDQRNAGSAAGNNNLGKLNLSQMISDLEAVVKVLEFRYEGTGYLFMCSQFRRSVSRRLFSERFESKSIERVD